MTPDARGRIHRTLVSAIPSYEYAQVRSPYLWINYYQHGRPVRESTGTKNEVVARRMLRTREGDVERGIPIDPKVGRITFHDVREDMLDDYKANRKKTYVDAKRRIDEHLAPFFGNRRGGAGRRISDCGFYQAWRRAREAAGCAGSIPHDFRRTAIRNMVRARISERVAMKLSGHKTRSVFDRYNVVSDGDLRDAARRLGHTGGHTSPSLAFGGGEKAQNP